MYSGNWTPYFFGMELRKSSTVSSSVSLHKTWQTEKYGVSPPPPTASVSPCIHGDLKKTEGMYGGNWTPYFFGMELRKSSTVSSSVSLHKTWQTEKNTVSNLHRHSPLSYHAPMTITKKTEDTCGGNRTPYFLGMELIV